MPRIRAYCNTGFAGSDYNNYINVDDEEWAAWSETERDNFLAEAANDMLGYIDYGAYVMEPEEKEQ